MPHQLTGDSSESGLPRVSLCFYARFLTVHKIMSMGNMKIDRIGLTEKTPIAF
jgi:hypothetical protein